jgi:hypothetical protein
MDPPNPVSATGDHLLLDDFDDDGVATFLGVTGASSPLLAAELRQLGGALATADTTGGVFNHVAEQFLYSCVGSAASPESTAVAERRAEQVRAALAPWDTGRTVPSFVASRSQPQRHLDGAQIGALDKVRSRVDPNGLFHGDTAPNATAHSGDD